jgi:hypothetical protein
MAIYKDQMYFGNRNYMQWVRAPQINYDSSKRGWFGTAGYLNGGQFVRRSSTAAKGYVFTWNMKSRDEIRAINDYYDGVYGTGAIYFLDPFAMDKNVLPQYWATPALANNDAPLLAGAYDEDRPIVLPTDPNTNGYPYLTATYNIDSDTLLNTVFIPVPPGYTLWLGFHGSVTGTANVVVTPTTGPTSTGTSFAALPLPVQTTQRVNVSVDGDTYTGAVISFGGAGTLKLAGLIAQVLPTGRAPEPGGFISGQGHSGCSYFEEPTLTNYSAAIDKVSMTANLVETEGWR